MKKKGNLLTENLIFIILNLTFLAILIVFVFTKMGSESVDEEMRAKQIALVLDAAKSGMVIEIDMKEEIQTAEENGLSPKEVVKISGNEVRVSFREEGGYSYSFFSDFDVSVDVFPTDSSKPGIVRLLVE